MADSKPITATAALKAFAGLRLKITDFARDGKGNVIVEKKKNEGGRVTEIRTPETRAIAERDVLSAVDVGDRIVMVLADGRRLDTADKVADKEKDVG